MLEERNESEAAYLEMNTEAYKETDHEFKAKYGYVRPGEDFYHTEDLPYSGTARYGGDVYVFDQEKVSNRLTWTLQDSLGGVHSEERLWGHRLIPWDYIGLLIPYVEKSLKREWPEFEMGQADKKLFPHLNDGTHGGLSGYAEIQFWGPIGLEDLKKFIFTGEPPKGQFLKKLKENNVSIYEAREDPETGASTIRPWNSR